MQSAAPSCLKEHSVLRREINEGFKGRRVEQHTFIDALTNRLIINWRYLILDFGIS